MGQTKTQHPVDIHVGNKLRQMRRLRGMTQSELAAPLGIKFQQIQKFEVGKNRISASRIYEFSEVLRVPVDYFYADLDVNPNKRISRGSNPEFRDLKFDVPTIRSTISGFYPDLQYRISYLVKLVLEERARFALLPIPNEAEAHTQYEKEDRFLQLMQAGLISVHQDLPTIQNGDITNDDALLIRDQLIKVANLANSAVNYLDQDNGTYGGLYKIGLISGIAGLLSTIPGVSFLEGAILPSAILGAQTIRLKIRHSDS